MIVYHSINNVNSIYTIIIIQIYLLFMLHRLIFDRSICNSFEIKYITHLAVAFPFDRYCKSIRRKLLESVFIKKNNWNLNEYNARINVRDLIIVCVCAISD